MNTFNLNDHELTVGEVHRNLPPSSLYEHAIRYEKGASMAENGALVAYSGAKTGRSPKDKRVVKNPSSEKDVWWGKVNIPFDAHTFAINRQRAIDYLNSGNSGVPTLSIPNCSRCIDFTKTRSGESERPLRMTQAKVMPSPN